MDAIICRDIRDISETLGTVLCVLSEPFGDQEAAYSYWGLRVKHETVRELNKRVNEVQYTID